MASHKNKTLFKLPPKGTFQRGGPDDPLPYYYHPVVGCLFRGRINAGLSLLSPPYKSILDVGYGSGILLPTLRSICDELVAIDRDTEPGKISPALDRMGVSAKLVQGDIAHSGLREDGFDLVVSFSVFEEVQDIESALACVRRLVRPGGDLLVGMPRVDRLMTVLFRLMGYVGIEDEHVHSYIDFLDLACRKGGFRLKRMTTFPRGLPRCLSLYYCMLLTRPE